MNLMAEPVDRSRQAGFTLLQLLLVVALIGVITAMSVVGIAGARDRLRLANAEQELRGNLEKARTNSIKRRAQPGTESTVEVIDATTYRVTMDFNGDGVLGATEFRDVTLPDGVTFQTSPMPAEVVFDRKGYLQEAVSIVTQSHYDSMTVSVTGAGGITSSSGLVSGTPVPTPTATPTPTPTPTPVPPSGTGGCLLELTTSPAPNFQVRKNGLSTGTVTVNLSAYGNPGEVTAIATDPVTEMEDTNVAITPAVVTVPPGTPASFSVRYTSSGFGFTRKLTFNSPCGAKTVNLSITN